MRRLAFVILLLSAIGLQGCKGCQKSGGSDRLKVAVSIFPIYDLVRRVAGPDADVSLLLQPGRNEHHFDPTPRDVEAAAASKLGVMVGLGLDPWMEKLMKDAAPDARILKVGDRVPILTIKDDPIGAEDHDDHDEDEHADGGHHEEHHDEHEEHHEHEKKGAPDPHVWLDPQRAQLIVRAIAEELGRVDTAHALAYRARATELDKSLVEVDREAAERLKKLSKKGFVTFHGSFGYFAERYKLNIIAVIEPYPGSEPTGEYVQKVLTAIKDKKVPALYSEPQLDPRPAKILAEEAKIPLGVLDPVGGGPETDSYEKMIRFDVAQLEKYLK
ncbi:MAG: zinc ABC transporter substrate-binding protein [Labilithrix sp.]|nr:zinc ABC transporter substrate-binding protein [Labilithrix sp.]MCW5818231.1 zinc ABC transporter substrate-binding protein [Labilithrix sp.]